ncbi:MAG: pentapeptide repeat-containing protein [Myxococcales bacterium]|nr:pentapeptide repeat-containing protein [Myxococcales bacterium]
MSLWMVATLGAGCGAVGAGGSAVGMLEGALDSDNGVALNGVSLNGVSMNGIGINGIALNGIGLNGVSLNGVGLNGISLNGVSLNGVGLNGVGLNGVGLNGVGLNGVGLNGVGLNGVGLNGVSLNGVGLNGVSLNGVGLNGVGLNGIGINGVGMNGAMMTGLLSTGGTVQLRIDSVVAHSDFFFYTVSYANKDGWQRLCGTEKDGSAVMAIPLAGLWDYSQGTETGGAHIVDASAITFACRHTALAKCVEFGYKPWQSAGNKSLADHHQACTRMVRADYCGDGVAWTREGETIDLYDALGIQVDTQPKWVFEAEFRTDGAACVSKERVKEIKTIDGKNPRKCIEDRVNGMCGAPKHFNAGTLIMVRHPKKK